MDERYYLTLERIMKITEEETVEEPYRSYFVKVAEFLLHIHDVKESINKKIRNEITEEQLRQEMELLYEDVLPENYAASYANPVFAVQELGEELGQFLSALYAELRGDIGYVFEKREEYLTIGNELFIEIYNQFEEGVPTLESLKEIFYWYASDYCDVWVADRIKEQIDPSFQPLAVDIIMESDLSDLRYLYKFGEYIGENEYRTASYINTLPQETIDKMADTFTEGFRIGFITTGKDLSKKAVVDIRYSLGFERVVRKAIENFRKIGLETVIYRAASSIMTKSRRGKSGYLGGQVNKQYDYDHKDDVGLVLDKQYVERRLEVMQTVYEQNKEQAGLLAGPAVMEVFGENPFAPVTVKEAVSLTDKQEELALNMNSRAGQIVNEYIKGEERSFTIISWPVPEIGDRFEEIFDEVIKINTLDYKLYQNVQQKLIDALDKGVYAHVYGKNGNKTDIKVMLHKLNDPSKETIFENCVADVNIPVGEVFTSPVLEQTNGTLFVSKVYLKGLQYKDLELKFKDGKVEEYNCSNFETEEENKKYIKDNIMNGHDFLPLGEFAIGTNTTAYAVAQKYDIADRFTILIAEKMGPHFAVGDTCYSWEEDVKTYNPDGKEIVAKENSISAQRNEDPEKAYFQCHTDITIPYEELGGIDVITEEGDSIALLKDGRFVLPGTEILNQPLEN